MKRLAKSPDLKCRQFTFLETGIPVDTEGGNRSQGVNDGHIGDERLTAADNYLRHRRHDAEEGDEHGGEEGGGEGLGGHEGLLLVRAHHCSQTLI